MTNDDKRERMSHQEHLAIAIELTKTHVVERVQAFQLINAIAAALDAAEQRGMARAATRRDTNVNDLICSCGHWYRLHAGGACSTCGCANAAAIRRAGGEQP